MTNESMMITILLITAALALMALNIITEREKRALRKKNAEYIEANSTLYRRVDALLEENNAMKKTCEDLADENATLHSENIKLQARGFGVMMRDWKRIEDGERVYYEKDKIRLIVEDGKVVGWYMPENCAVVEKLDKNK